MISIINTGTISFKHLYVNALNLCICCLQNEKLYWWSYRTQDVFTNQLFLSLPEVFSQTIDTV